MKQKMKLKTILLAGFLFIAGIASAQDGTNADAKDKTNKDKQNEAEYLTMAGQLVKYGYSTESALPLIQALEIYNRLGVHDETDKMSKESKTDENKPEEKKSGDASVSFDPAKIKADAKEFADGDENLLALLSSVSGSRGALNGAIRHYDRVRAYTTDTYTINFRGGYTAYVYLTGDGDTDLDLYVYDQNGNLIDSDTDYSDNCVCVFTPRWTGRFYIKVVNRGRVYNNYVLYTN